MQLGRSRSLPRARQSAHLATWATLVIAACGSDTTDPEPPGEPEPAGGTLRVLMRTTGATLDRDGYSYRVGSLTLALAVQDSQDIANLPAGEVSVELGGVASNCRDVAPGPSSVAIAEHQIATVALLVSCDSAFQNVVLYEHWSDGRRPDLWVMRPDGTGKELFLVGAWGPAVTPSGTEVVFSDWAAGTLWRIRADKAIQRPVLADHMNGRYDPDMSPDGESVVFSQRSGELAQIFRVGINGDDLKQLTSGSQDWDPRWSPDGRVIAFTRFGSDNNARVYLVPAEGGDTVRLTEDGTCCARWSPQGDRLIYSISNELRTIASDGSEATTLSLPFLHHVQDAEWNPDGTQILVEAHVADRMELWRVPLDGTEGEAIATEPLYNRLGRWLR